MNRYKSIHRYLLEKKLEIIFSKISNKNSLIELGCPDYRHQHLYNDFNSVIVADLNPSVKGVLQVDLNKKLPFKTNSFDFILTTEVIEYVSNHKIFFSECLRILKPGGSLILSTPMFANLHNDLIRYTKQGLKMHMNQFNSIKIEPIGNLFTISLDFFRRESKFFGKFFYAIQIILIYLFGKKLRNLNSSYPSGYIVLAIL